MATNLLQLKTYLPQGVYSTVYDVDYQALYDAGKRLIIMDIDNTLIPYDETHPNSNIVTLFDRLKAMGFAIALVSNNHLPRVREFSDALGCSYVASARKPFSKGYRKIAKLFPTLSRESMHAIGDQLMTDVAGANRMGISCTLVRVLKWRSEKWYTKLNRKIEQIVLKRMDKHYPDIAKKIRAIQES
ncbi:MAG: YqeG family HAD IIIA-type phosphatase [Bacilli bacterium]|nr:YqeG family HAD IIIA-type phosphatase [Bacilli bacterium]